MNTDWSLVEKSEDILHVCTSQTFEGFVFMLIKEFITKT